MRLFHSLLNIWFLALHRVLDGLNWFNAPQHMPQADGLTFNIIVL